MAPGHAAASGNLVDANTHEIAAVGLIPDDVGDVSLISDLLDQIGSRSARLQGMAPITQDRLR